ncbi:hypothetical protein HELRODRAFT_164120 [Helobdella robusta]|uniref:Uncharacterized protein n=1 Tax=Helobdella robusta TaxID=6412 RepID=T1EUY4_HELRO|nr:hypothetical protein HELRODRAFT_164120 [Helobdella robusta]ESN94303.1 hypothetical protein HELRODRAFT_164120 [Helobdella robusta]
MRLRTNLSLLFVSASGSSSTDISDEHEIRIIETPRRSGKETQQMRELPNLNTDLLSTDQKYLYQMCFAISAELANFIMKVYAPTWFDIKTKSSCKYGSIHVFNMLVTEASTSVCGPEARDKFIRTRIKARQDIQIVNTKSQYFGKKEGAETLELRH